MRNKICFLTGFFGGVLLLFSVSAGAQVTEPAREIYLGQDIKNNVGINNVGQNPFDLIQDMAEVRRNETPIIQKQKSQLSASASRIATRKTNGLKYRKKFNGSDEQRQALYKTLVQQYGEPLSVRGQSHVWDIKNPTGGGEQADIVTVILKMAPGGSYELIMDRDRGENGRATWSAPRIEPAPTLKKQQKQAKKFQPILQPDND